MERSLLYQFKIIERDQTPRSGECKILLGDRVSPQQISNGNNLVNKNSDYNANSTEVSLKVSGAALACGYAIFHSAKFVAAVIAGGAATAKSVGAATPIVAPVILGTAATVGQSWISCQ